MAAATSKLHAAAAAAGALLFSSPPHQQPTLIPLRRYPGLLPRHPLRRLACKATEVSQGVEQEEPKVDESSTESGPGEGWVPVVPLAALPRGERRVIIQDGQTILLLWYKDDVFAIENRSPAEGAYSEGLLNAKLTQDGCIVCPTTDSTFDLQTGAVKDWYPKNPVLRVLTPPLRSLFVYPVKTDGENIYISMSGGIKSGVSAEIVFSGKAQPGLTAEDVNVEEVRMLFLDTHLRSLAPWNINAASPCSLGRQNSVS
ncbi:hypothetical protein J5N97_012694 [Dioscorea zingiberensis]|uniref:Rieske domain-containing protein n=1 Tax=Dioscorea zingiberensis TaxID=325984 RepID=A0A9D5HHZ7_9LILI|nr:hypothetical protein J5N97_012694 [Dioscorea zingiberensis]